MTPLRPGMVIIAGPQLCVGACFGILCIQTLGVTMNFLIM